MKRLGPLALLLCLITASAAHAAEVVALGASNTYMGAAAAARRMALILARALG